MSTANGSFELASWDETAYDDGGDGARLTRAEVTQRFQGDIDGDGAVQWLMAYRPDGTARFVGLQKVSGTIADRRGSFVLETRGDFEGQMARWDASVIPGSGTDELVGLKAQGSFEAPHGSRASFTLEYDFE